MKNSIEIIAINQFSELNNSDWNAKVTYTKNGKMYVACVYANSFWKRIEYPTKQQKGGKVLKGLHEAIISDYQKRGFNWE